VDVGSSCKFFFFLRNKDVDLIYGDAVRIDLLTKREKLLLISTFHKNLFVLGRGMGIIQPSTFLKKNVFEKYGYFSNKYKLSADSEFWVRLVHKGAKIKKVDEILCIETIHTENFSFVNIPLYFTEINLLREDYLGIKINKNFLKVLEFLIKLRSKVLYRFFLLKFFFIYISYIFLSINNNKNRLIELPWFNYISKGKINLRKLINEIFSSSNKSYGKLNFISTFTEEYLKKIGFLINR
jgi:hypothetical protein